MKLDRRATEFYRLRISSDPDDLEWTASFDDGATYVAGTYDEDLRVWKWLLSGPEAEGSGTELPVGTHRPLIRATAGLESVVRTAPAIKVL